ncbi:hypothetical protein [Bradyrhizobium sp. NP1]|nr:hypothetical protein [Bradyrhizobium sp. NP1]WJR75311.1 hypothetical protein QOU61_21130 [Bradyrhizobium sp. NP1]
MTRNTREPYFGAPNDLRIDYALIATGIGAALFALLYLLLT